MRDNLQLRILKIAVKRNVFWYQLMYCSHSKRTSVENANCPSPDHLWLQRPEAREVGLSGDVATSTFITEWETLCRSANLEQWNSISAFIILTSLIDIQILFFLSLTTGNYVKFIITELNVMPKFWIEGNLYPVVSAPNLYDLPPPIMGAFH